MKPLIILISVFSIGLLIVQLRKSSKGNINVIGRIALACMLLFTGISHFPFAEGMSSMIPAFLPYPVYLVYASGIFEIVAAIGLLFKLANLLG